jgi:MoaA/NifB/PqqE/SkfB family radical SAM enzyme
MRCRHCGFACTERGHDMTQETFTNALKLVTSYDAYFTLGGGEPLLHPLFFDFAWQGIRETMDETYSNGCPCVGVVTNGKCERESVKLARMAEMGFISARLSLDPYHEPISERVKHAFGWQDEADHYSTRRQRKDNDARAIGGANAYNIVSAGRAQNWGGEKKCFCDSVLITPNGRIWHCSCKRIAYGNVNDSNLELPWYFGDILSEEGCSRKFEVPTKEEPANLVLESA